MIVHRHLCHLLSGEFKHRGQWFDQLLIVFTRHGSSSHAPFSKVFTYELSDPFGECRNCFRRIPPDRFRNNRTIRYVEARIAKDLASMIHHSVPGGSPHVAATERVRCYREPKQ